MNRKKLLYIFLYIFGGISTLNAQNNAQNQLELDSLLIDAVEKSQLRDVELLLKKGANVEGLVIGSMSVVPLRLAKDVKIAKLLIENGANVNSDDGRGYQAIHSPYNAEIAKLLIENGANVNAGTDNGFTPLFYINNVEIAKILIENGANVRQKNPFGDTPLHFVEDTEVIRLLIDKGADINAKDDDGDTPLHYSSSAQKTKLLIESGAQIDTKNSRGNTPLHSAKNVEIAKLLIENGADINMLNNEANNVLHILLLNGVSRQNRFKKNLIEFFINQQVSTTLKNKAGKSPKDILHDLGYQSFMDLPEE